MRGRGWVGLLAPLGALVAGGSFFLPYVRVIRVLGMSLTLAGPRIGGGLWLVPAAAALVLLAQVWPARPRRQWLGRMLAGGGAVLGLLVVIGVVARLHHRTGVLFVHFSAATLGVRPSTGWFLGLVGFTLALVGTCLPRRAR